MHVVDLTEDYENEYIKNGDRLAYEDSFPELFDYYYRFWASRERDIAAVSRKDIQIRKGWVSQLIEKLSSALTENEIDLDSIGLIYFIGAGTTNGHAIKYQNKFYVWLPLETYTSKKLVKVFVTHEIAHALHYHYSPSFYFNSRDNMLQVSRQLISEGLATYITRELLGISDLQALWADYLSEGDAQKWQRDCEAEENNLYRLIVERFYGSVQDMRIFIAADPKDIYQFRSGYYIGLKLIANYASKNNLTLKDLLKLPRQKFEIDILELINSRG